MRGPLKTAGFERCSLHSFCGMADFGPLDEAVKAGSHERALSAAEQSELRLCASGSLSEFFAALQFSPKRRAMWRRHSAEWQHCCNWGDTRRL